MKKSVYHLQDTSLCTRCKLFVGKTHTLSILLLFSSFCCFSIYSQPDPSYKLVFEDQFSIHPNASGKWNVENCQTRGDELQWFMAENIELFSDLKIIAKEETVICGGEEKNYTSGQIFSMSSFKYGYFEIECQLPHGNGMFPAFWLHPIWAFPNYQEIDIFEACGCNCYSVQVGTFQDNDYDITNHDPEHISHDAHVNNSCDSFHKYAAEWTPNKVKFFVDNVLVKTVNNSIIHESMFIYVNLSVGGDFSCETGDINPCEVNNATYFPATYKIRNVKAYQKENEILFVEGHSATMCVGEELEIKAPFFPDAQISWNSLSSGLQVEPIQYYWGNRYSAKIKAINSGLHSFEVTITFPSGYIETKTYNVRVLSDTPPTAPNIILTKPHHGSCCYGLFVPYWPTNSDIFNWTIQHFNGLPTEYYSTNDPTLGYYNNIPCFNDLNLLVTLEVVNATCEAGTDSYTQYISRPSMPTCLFKSLWVNPNPSSNNIIVQIKEENENLSSFISGEIRIVDTNGLLIHTEAIDHNSYSIDISFLNNGNYTVFYTEGEATINTSFIKE